MEVFPGISMDPDVRFGKPCLSGTRIDVATVVGALAAGESADAVADEYSLTHAQVQAALAFAAPRGGAPSASSSPRFVKVLLDENFPLGLVRVLRADGLEVDHIITLAWRARPTPAFASR